ncbi:hypothetical protein CEXT_158931 [Caerostris extrusa]|uniref:Uncharacterized protein n=1 Tax=Caerostris extrusa TaxID=172846 RepID=A0AAV4XMA3_CAEEX|nr:hypothetical protein CEXT_158931 [Caerostris extrusa]
MWVKSANHSLPPLKEKSPSRLKDDESIISFASISGRLRYFSPTTKEVSYNCFLWPSLCFISHRLSQIGGRVRIFNSVCLTMHSLGDRIHHDTVKWFFVPPKSTASNVLLFEKNRWQADFVEAKEIVVSSNE